MIQESNVKTETVAETDNAATEKKTTPAKVTRFDKLPEAQQIEVLSKAAQDNRKTLDITLLAETLKRNGIMKLPSDGLVANALQSRKTMALGEVAFKKSRQLIIETYEAAKAEGFTPQEARKLVVILVTDNGRILSERTVRNYLPTEAKDQSKNRSEELKAHHEEKRQQAEQSKTEEERKGWTPLIVPVMWAEEIAKFAAKKEACILFHDGKVIHKVKPAVVHEEMGKDGKLHKVQEAAPAPQAQTPSKKVKVRMS